MNKLNLRNAEALTRIKDLKTGVLISESGTCSEEEFKPADGKVFTLKELQTAVKGHIEIYPHESDLTGKVVIVNEEGLHLQMRPNMLASIKYDIDAVGPVLIILKEQIE